MASGKGLQSNIKVFKKIARFFALRWGKLETEVQTRIYELIYY